MPNTGIEPATLRSLARCSNQLGATPPLKLLLLLIVLQLLVKITLIWLMPRKSICESTQISIFYFALSSTSIR